ncbi:STAS domain-containing protein [Streptosporangium sp. NPDC051023]|uniref:STAS domain-containing protein n=1 Tax=Streptosporangium sp. NPDC051023 TaxID=3155410 RepID=UPI00344C9372
MTVNVTAHTSGGVTTARIEGEITSTTASGVQERLLSLLGGAGRLLIDFSGVSYISSAGLRMLLILYRRAEQAGTGIALGGLSNEVQFVMSATGFLGFFEITDDLESETGRVRP